jgi:hypothetical protein
LLLDLASAFILKSEFRRTHDYILLSQIRDSHQLVAQVPVFISPRNRVASCTPPALGSLSAAFYDSQANRSLLPATSWPLTPGIGPRWDPDHIFVQYQDLCFFFSFH